MIALVIGGASGIGAACAQRLARDGATVVVADIAGTGRFVDVGDAESVRTLVEDVIREHGCPAAVINSAGITGPLELLGDYPVDAYEEVIRVNLNGVFHVLRYVLPHMQQAGGGVVVNIASVAGSSASRAHSAYVAAKHGVLGLTKTAAREYAGYGIRVVSVSPGVIDSPMTAALPPGTLDRALESVPAKRLGLPEEVADFVAFLVSDAAAYVNGSDHPIDGGYLTQ